MKRVNSKAQEQPRKVEYEKIFCELRNWQKTYWWRRIKRRWRGHQCFKPCWSRGRLCHGSARDWRLKCSCLWGRKGLNMAILDVSLSQIAIEDNLVSHNLRQPPLWCNRISSLIYQDLESRNYSHLLAKRALQRVHWKLRALKPLWSLSKFSQLLAFKYIQRQPCTYVCWHGVSNFPNSSLRFRDCTTNTFIADFRYVLDGWRLSSSSGIWKALHLFGSCHPW